MATKYINHNIKPQIILEIRNRGLPLTIIDDIIEYCIQHGQNLQYYGNWDVVDVAIAFL
jgi:hypothetical protein